MTMSQATVVEPTSILDHRTLNTEQGAIILIYKVFHKGKDNFISQKVHLHSSSGIKEIDPPKDKG
jgi:hypothetical protein